MGSLTADEERGFWSRSSGNELRGAASYFIIVASVPKWDGVEKLREPLIISNLSLPRRRESSNVKSLWIPAFAGMTFLEVALINRSVTGNDFLAFRYELAYNGLNLCENEAKYSAFQPISA